MKKLTKILSFALAFVCLSLCFVGCSLGKNAELLSLDLSNPLPSEFCLGDTLDLTGKKLTLTYSDDSQKEIQLTDSMLTVKLDTTSATTQPRTMVITYKGKTITSNYTVLNAKQVGLYKLYFDRTYTLTSVKLYKNNTYVADDNDFYSSSMRFTSNGTGTADIDTSFTWTANDSNNTILVMSEDPTDLDLAIILTLNENGISFTLTYPESYASTYDTEVRFYTLQNAY